MLTTDDKHTLQTIYEKLAPMSTHESAFTGMENLFYRALQLARNYGNDEAQNQLLRDFIEVKETVYSETQRPYSKSRQREVSIVHFKTAFKKKLAHWIK